MVLNNLVSYPGRIILFFNVYFIFGRERERNHKWGMAEKEGDAESEAGSRLQDVSTEPDAGLELKNCEIMTRAEVRHLIN